MVCMGVGQLRFILIIKLSVIVMGTYLSRNQQEISESLREQYDIEAQPYLLHRRTQQLCTLHKLTAKSQSDCSRIRQAIEEYQRTRCESISKLRTHYHLDNSGYCSDEQSFFLVFEGQNSYTLREEFAKRRLYRTPFNEQEIQQVAETLLCGLREYDHRFQRDYDKLSLDSLIIDQKTHRLYLRDPWLAGDTNGQGDPLTSLLLHYPSPEKLHTAYSSKCEDYKQFLSNLFSVGVIALELKRLEFADGIYMKKREVNYDEVKVRINEFISEKMKKGLECLMNPDPNERKKIFQMWGIENKEEHYLQPILTQKDQTPSPILKMQNRPDSSPIKTNQFRTTTTSVNNQLNRAPSEATILPPLTINPNSRTNVPAPLSSRSNRSDFSNIPPHAANPSMHPVTFQHQPVIVHNNPTKFTFSHNASINSNHNPSSFHGFVPSVQQQQPMPVVHFGDKGSATAKPIQTITVNNYAPQISATSLTFSEIYNKKSRETQLADSTKPQAPIIPPNQPVSQPQSVNTSSISKPQSNGWSFNQLTDYKESLYEQQPRPSNAASLQTHTQSPVREREVNSILVDEKHEVRPPIEKSPSIIDKILAENIDQQQQHQQEKKEEEPPREFERPKEREKTIINDLLNTITEEASTSPIIIDNTPEPAYSYPKAQQQQSQTPNRPTAKNKYNSTIVQVRDEDSPDVSLRSQDAVEEEYVVEEYETGSRYEGFKSGGMRNGRGKFYYQDGGYYEGQWRNNKMDGYGKLYYEGGKLAYQGNWSQDEFNGLGKVFNDNPLPLQSPFDYTNFQLLEDYWEYYEGMLVHDTKQGRGRIKLSNGQIFEGDFHNDRIQGFGKFTNKDGRIIEGIWRESKLIKIINSPDNR